MNSAKPEKHQALYHAMQKVIDGNELLKAAILLHAKQLPRAGVTGKVTLLLIEAINEMKYQYEQTES